MKTFLMGYMGSGKSTIGPLLATALSYKFIDFDQYITQAEGMSIPEIFTSKGEIYFRKVENSYLKQLLDTQEEEVVIALGGGTPCYANNLDLIKKAGARTVYLNWHFKILSERLWEARSDRPLIASMESQEALEDYVRKHLFERAYYYNQAAYSIKVESQTPEAITQEILDLLF